MQASPPELAQRVLEAAPDAMIIVSAGGVIRYANRQAAEIFGYPSCELTGLGVEQLMPARFHARHRGHRQHYREHLRARPMGTGLSLYARRRDGTEFPVEISLAPIEHGGEQLVAAAIRDATARMQVEAELIAAREAAERARLIADEAHGSALRANQNKSRLLAAASHDLRQPLQALALLNGTLQRLAVAPDIAAAVAQQSQAIGAMSRLVNALLDISKLESGAVKPRPTDFTVMELFAGLQRDFVDLAGTKGIELQIEPCTQCVHSDPSLVEQILRNLVSNAIKYTREGWVRLRCLHTPARVRIEVLDTGVGIPADQLSLIYEEFYQVDAGTGAHRDGYGLGLAIVQRLVQLLGLTLDVSSEVGRGSTFALVLPAAAGAPTSAEPRLVQRTLRHTGRARVLLVEDESGVRDAMRLLLSTEGYRVAAAACLEEALAQLALHGSFDLVVTDYHLRNGETGLEVLAAVRERTRHRLKAVLVTGDTSSAIRALPANPDLRVTSKPVDAEELLALLRGLLAE